MRAALVLLILCAAAHAGNRVVVMTGRDDMPAALQIALANQHVEVAVQPESPTGALRLDRAAAAQRIAMDGNADASVWIDGGEIWVVSADGRYLRHAPVPGDASPRVFAAIAASLLDELLAPPEGTSVGVDVHVDVPLPAAAPPPPMLAPAPAPAPPPVHQQLVVAPPIAAAPGYAALAPGYAQPSAEVVVPQPNPEARVRSDLTIFELGAALSTASIGIDAEIAFPLTNKVRLGVLGGLDYMFDGFGDTESGDTMAHAGGELRYVGAGINHIDFGLGGGFVHNLNTDSGDTGGFAMLRIAFTHEMARSSVSFSLSPMMLFDFQGQDQNDFSVVASLRIGHPL